MWPTLCYIKFERGHREKIYNTCDISAREIFRFDPRKRGGGEGAGAISPASFFRDEVLV